MLKKAVAYIRVSSKEQQEQGYSPDAQKRLLWDFALSNGFDVVEEFEEAETAKEAGRAAFNAMIKYIQTHDVKHILVEKTDRLHRNFRDYVAIEDIVKSCGITVHFVKENTSIGQNARSSERFMYGIRTLMAKNFIDNLSEEVIKGQNEKIAAGEFAGKAPLGYLNVQHPTTKKATIIVDEKIRPLIKEIYRLYATGLHTLNSVIIKVEELGLTELLPTGRKLNKTTIAKLLQNPFYIGHFLWKGQVHKGVHEVMIDPTIWQKVQDVLIGKRGDQHKESNCKVFLFRGLLTCGECGRTITAYIKKGRYTYYRCTKYQRVCSQVEVTETSLLNEASVAVQSISLSENGVAYVAAALKESLEEKRSWHDRVYQEMVSEKDRLKNRLDKMYEDHLDGKVSDPFYDQKFKEYSERMMGLEQKIAEHDRADINYYEFGQKILELAKNAQLLLKEATSEERREFFSYLLSNSVLKDGKANFQLKQPFSTIAKHSPVGERSLRGEFLDDFRTLDWAAIYKELCIFPIVAIRILKWNTEERPQLFIH